tara:strand:- start:1636 stop:2925 length:1290 start_codon:yes stop_codon:yes gene_type:complete
MTLDKVKEEELCSALTKLKVKSKNPPTYNLTIHAINDDYMKEVFEKLLNSKFKIKCDTKKIKNYKIKNHKPDWCVNLVGMEYDDNEKMPFIQITNNKKGFSKEEIYELHEILGIKVIDIRWCYYPYYPTRNHTSICVENEQEVKHKYPIYVLSKSRYYRNKKYQAPKTIQYLEQIKADYFIVIEEEEYEDYNKSIASNRILVLPKTYELNGSGVPARNFIHHLNIKNNTKAYWCLDDNISRYYFTNFQKRYKVNSQLSFRYVEDIFDKFSNVYLSGHAYKFHIIAKEGKPIIQFNKRIFSSILIRTDIPVLNDNNDIWRGKYNEDTDLSLRILKLGLPTLLISSMSSDKEQTGRANGGNEQIYKEDDNASGVAKTLALLEEHANDFKITTLSNRIHHKIKTELFDDNVLKSDVDLYDKNNWTKYKIKYY